MANEDISLFVLDKNFVPFYAVSEFTSFIWSEKYWEYDEFQLDVIYQKEFMDVFKVDYYLSLGDSPNLMVIEAIQISYDPTNVVNRTIRVVGRSLESLLERRIAWGEWGQSYPLSIQSIIFGLIDQTIVNPEDSRRKISFFRTKSASGVSGITATVSGDGDNVYEVSQALCEANSVGMKCDYDETAKTVSFTLYVGVDRSYDQLERPPVIFSSGYENIGATRFAFNTKEYKTIAFAVGPWVETDEETGETDENGDPIVNTKTTRTSMEVGALSLSGLDRREVFVKASEDEPAEIEYKAMETIANANVVNALDAELDPKRQFVYGQDFFLGDVVQVITDFGLDAKARVVGFIRSWESDGYSEVPTFKILEE